MVTYKCVGGGGHDTMSTFQNKQTTTAKYTWNTYILQAHLANSDIPYSNTTLNKTHETCA